MVSRDREQSDLENTRLIEGGKFVKDAERILPPTREVRLQQGWHMLDSLQAVPGRDMPYHFGRVAATISGTPMGTITDFWVEYLPAVGGSYGRATVVPANADFRCYIAANCNSGGGTSWAICCTVIDLNGSGIKNWGKASVGSLGIGGSVTIAPARLLLAQLGDPMIMPNANLNLSFRLYASFDATPSDPSSDMYY